VIAQDYGLYSINPTTGSPSLLQNLAFLPTSLAAIADNVYVASLSEVDSYNQSTAAFGRYQGLGASAITPEANGRLLIGGYEPPVTPTPQEIRSFDPTQTTSPFGLQIVSANSSSFTGRVLYANGGIGVGADGQIIVTNFFNAGPPLPFPSQVLSVDPLTGNRTILSDATHGMGPTFVYAAGVYIVPEPSTIVLAALGMIALLAYKRTRS
jgi:hypothetical protein